MSDCEKFELDLVEYLDGTLSGPRLAALEEHLAGCPDCARRAKEMRAILSETRALGEEIPDGLHEAIMERIDRETSQKKLLRFPSRRVFAAAAAVFVLVCAGAVGTAALRNRNKNAGAPATAGGVMTAQNSVAYSAYAGSDEAAPESAEEIEEDVSFDTSAVKSSVTEEAAEDEAETPMTAAAAASASEAPVPEEEPAPSPDDSPAESIADEEDIPMSEEEERSDSGGDGENVFAALRQEDARYCAVVVMDVSALPLSRDELKARAEDSGRADRVWIPEEAGETVCLAVPRDLLDALLTKLQDTASDVAAYSTADPGPAEGLLDDSADAALVILRTQG